MRRMFLVLTAAALVAVMVVASATPAMAKDNVIPRGDGHNDGGGHHKASGGGKRRQLSYERQRQRYEVDP